MWVALVGIILLAIHWRFYGIKSYPPGLFPDVAANGEDALRILHGDIRPFYDTNNGREGLFFYLQAASIAAFGVKVWPLYVASAVVGVLTVIATYFATRVFFGRLAGLLAALFLATSHWHVTLSRTGFRAIMTPLFIALFTAFVGYTIYVIGKPRKKSKKKILLLPRNRLSYLFAVLAGVSFAGGFYTYISYRAMIGVVGGVVLLLLLAAMHPKIGFPHFRRYGREVFVGLLAAAITISPLAWYFFQHPEQLVGRVGQVSVFNPDRQQGRGLLLTVWDVTQRSLLAYFYHGDANWRHNVAGYPFLNPLVGFLFLLGMAWAGWWTALVFRRVWQGKEIHLGMVYPYALLLFFGMTLPVIMTAEGIPHGLRAVGTIFPVFFLAGTAGAVLARWAQRQLKGAWQWLAWGVTVGLLVLGVGHDYALYFVIARNDSGAEAAYRADLTVVVNYLNNYAKQHMYEPQPYLVLDGFSQKTVWFLTTPTRVGRLASQPAYRLVPPELSHLTQLKAGELMVFAQSSLPDADRYQQLHPKRVEVMISVRNRFNQEVMRVLRMKAAGPEGEGVDSLDA